MLFITIWLLLYCLENFIIFLSLNINFIFYKDYFNFLYNILSIFNNNSLSTQSQIINY